MKPMMRISPILGAALLALGCTPASPTASTASRLSELLCRSELVLTDALPISQP
jgi:hypothetical protein